MQRSNNFKNKHLKTALFFLVALGLIIADQTSKAWIRENLAVGQSLPETGFFRLLHVQNTGAAFGMFQEHTEVLTVISFIGIAVVMVYAFYISRRIPLLDNAVTKAALGAVLGGTIGNLIDRLQLGYVTDFLSVGSFAKFNVADASISVGITVFAIAVIYLYVKEQKKKEPAPLMPDGKDNPEVPGKG